MELPAGWVSTTLGDVADWGSGGTPKSGVSDYYGGDIPWVVSGDLNDKTIHSATSTITSDGLNSSSAKWVPEGSVLVAMYGATIGKLGITGRPLTTNQAIAFASPYHNLIDKRFLFWYLRSQRDALRKTGKGGAQPNISQTILKAWPIPVPPLAEQHRIVEALEDHLSRLDAASAGVKRCVTRSIHLWEATLNNVAEGALDGKKVDSETRPVSEVAEVSGGIQKQKKRIPILNTFPFLRVANVARGRLNLSEIHEIELFSGELEKHQLKRGDLLVVEGNGSPDQIGRAACWHDNIQNAVHQNHLIRVRPGKQLIPRYLELIWNSPVVINQLREVARSTSGLYTLSTSKVKAVQIPVPSLADQEALVAKADTWETYTLAARASLQRASVRSKSLRHAVLNRAFNGDLVPQDPADEPASVLLDRIRAEREAQGGKAKRGTRRPRKAADAAPSPAPASTPSPATAVQQELPL
ncbi:MULTISPECIES: restriction endonuclease subunit S [unclassified Streptomyces]|uniref:restriction endonuclease subunit S n=1 Tax=unclassified Streptomyces TaxID=2593676 RepID=UPI0036657D81